MINTEARLNAKRAFVLNDWLKSVPFVSAEAFIPFMGSEKSRIAQLSEQELDSIIARDADRLSVYNRADWAPMPVRLNQCLVHPKMGQREWAQGSVAAVAERFKRLEPLASRIWGMKLFADIFRTEMPLLVLVRDIGLEIDDGSHRAVAMALAGIEIASAWVGKLHGNASTEPYPKHEPPTGVHL